MRSCSNCKGGFSLIELLVVIAIFGIFSGAIYSLYITHMKTAFTREEVVDVQQNVRIAMDRLTQDIMMAGFLVPPDAISGKTVFLDPAMTNYSSMIRLRTASADATFVRINGAATTSAIASLGPIAASPASTLDRFRSGNAVRVIRPFNFSQPIDNVFTVFSSNKGSGTTTLASTPNSATFPAGIDYRSGDVICKVASTASPYPERVTYRIMPCMAGAIATSCLARCVNDDNCASPDYVAQNISSVKFSYLLEGDDTDYKTAAVLNDLDKLSTLRGVRVIVTGQTTRVANPGDAPKTRQLKSLVRLRNRR